MAAWDNVQLPQGPTPASYAGRLVDFSGIGNNIGNLYQDYAKGQVLQNQLAMQQPLKATDPQGIVRELLGRPGGAQYAAPLLQMLQRQQFMNSYSGQQSPSEYDNSQVEQSQPRQSVSVAPNGFPVQQSLEGLVSAVPESGPNAGRNIAPEVNAAGAAAGQPTRVAESAQPAAEDVASQPAGVAPAAPIPANVSEKAARNLDKVVDYYTNRANQAEALIGRGAGAGDLEKAKIAADRAAKMRETLKAYDPAAVALKGREKLQGLQMDRGEKLNTAYQGGATQYMESQKPYNDLARTILSEPGMHTGIGGDWSLVVNRARALVGDTKAAALQEALQKVTASSVLAQINNQRIELGEAGQTSSRIFSSQVDQVTKASPSLSTTLGGNRYLVNVSDRMGEFRTALAAQASKYRDQHGYLDKGWDAHLARYLNAHPVFTQEERSNPKLLMSPTVPPQLLDERGNPRDPTALKKWGNDLGLGVGDSVILPGNPSMQYSYKHWKG